MMRVVEITSLGGPEVLRLSERPEPEPGAGQVRVRHTAIGVNFIDTYHRTGLYPLPSLPHGIGLEGAGTIDAVGPDVALELGTRVAYFAGPPSSYADTRLVDADRVIELPDDIDDETAAAALLKGMTVEYLIRRTFPVERGMTVLFHAIAGGVGSLACQWLKDLGATVIGTTSSEEKAERARADGCDHVILYTRESVPQRVREITEGHGVPGVFDSVGKDTFMGSLDCLARRGMLVGFGNASGTPAPFDPMILARKGSLYYTRATLFDYVAEREDLVESARRLFDVLRRNAVRVHIGQRFALTEARECHEALESRKTIGSTLLLP